MSSQALVFFFKSAYFQAKGNFCLVLAKFCYFDCTLLQPERKMSLCFPNRRVVKKQIFHGQLTDFLLLALKLRSDGLNHLLAVLLTLVLLIWLVFTPVVFVDYICVG